MDQTTVSRWVVFGYQHVNDLVMNALTKSHNREKWSLHGHTLSYFYYFGSKTYIVDTL